MQSCVMDIEAQRRFELNHYSLRQIVQRMRPLVRPHRGWLLLASGMITLCGLAMALVPQFPRYIVDVALAERNRPNALELAIAAGAVFLVVQFIRQMIWYLAQTTIVRKQEEIVFSLRSNSFRHIQRLCLRFHSRYPSGYLHDRVFVQCITRIGVLTTYIFSQASLQAANLVFAMGMCLYMSIPMTGVILVGAIGYVMIARFMGPRIRERSLECSEAHNRVCGYIIDKLQGNKTIQAHALEDRVEREFDHEIWTVQEKYIRARVESMRLSMVSETLSYILTAAVWVLGVHAVLGWEMGLGTLLAFAGYQGQLISVITQITNVSGEIASARVGFDQFFTIMDTQSTISEHVADLPMERFAGRVEFRNVTFSYEDEAALKDVSFTVEAGQTVALVGRSGAGKSTVINMLMRFYDPNAGEILVDGKAIHSLPLRPYRARFGIVLQEPFLFDDTIEGNLLCVRPDASEQEIRTALQQAQALTFVESFPDGLQHRVGERGTSLSGGQRQRIAIARTLLLNPDILLLDEATSALDNESEAHIQQALETLFSGRTSFIIAHRLSTIRTADRIMVFDGGRLVEDGTYESLMAAKGLFRYLHDVATSTSTRKYKLDEAGFA